MLGTIKGCIQNIVESINNNHCRVLFSLLLATDVVIVLLYISHRVGRLYINQLDSGAIDFTLPMFDPNFIKVYLLDLKLGFDEGSFSELYQHLKEFWIVLMFSFIYFKRQNVIFLLWSFVFLYALADDTFMIHELAGFVISQNTYYAQTFGAGAYHFAEAGFFFAMFIVLLAPILLLYKKVDEEMQKIIINMILLIIGVAVFGVVFDFFETLSNHYVLVAICKVLDDGGEMIVMSVISAYVFSLAVSAQEQKGKAN